MCHIHQQFTPTLGRGSQILSTYIEPGILPMYGYWQPYHNRQYKECEIEKKYQFLKGSTVSTFFHVMFASQVAVLELASILSVSCHYQTWGLTVEKKHIQSST